MKARNAVLFRWYEPLWRNDIERAAYPKSWWLRDCQSIATGFFLVFFLISMGWWAFYSIRAGAPTQPLWKAILTSAVMGAAMAALLSLVHLPLIWLKSRVYVRTNGIQVAMSNSQTTIKYSNIDSVLIRRWDTGRSQPLIVGINLNDGGFECIGIDRNQNLEKLKDVLKQNGIRVEDESDEPPESLLS